MSGRHFSQDLTSGHTAVAKSSKRSGRVRDGRPSAGPETLGQQQTLERRRGDLTELAQPLRQPLRYENRGVDTIPEAERRSTPWTLFGIITGNSFALGGVIFGWVPISLGLSFWAALSSITVGTLVALIPITPLLLIGTRTATNNSTSSGADFGVRGRLIGSVIGLLMMLLATTAAVWTGGQVLVAASARLLHTPPATGSWRWRTSSSPWSRS